jgi:hypothetical protein
LPGTIALILSQSISLISKRLLLFYAQIYFQKAKFVLSDCQHSLKALVAGALLCVGARTVGAALRFLGLGAEKHFANYHRFLSRARCNALGAARILVNLWVAACCKEDEPLIFGIDQTIERRTGAMIKAKGIYGDPVRS